MVSDISDQSVVEISSDDGMEVDSPLKQPTRKRQRISSVSDCILTDETEHRTKRLSQYSSSLIPTSPRWSLIYVAPSYPEPICTILRAEEHWSMFKKIRQPIDLKNLVVTWLFLRPSVGPYGHPHTFKNNRVASTITVGTSVDIHVTINW